MLLNNTRCFELFVNRIFPKFVLSSKVLLRISLVVWIECFDFQFMKYLRVCIREFSLKFVLDMVGWNRSIFYLYENQGIL